MTIFAVGVGGCLALGFMMQHLLRVSQERNQPAIVREVNRVYGARLDGEARLRLQRSPEGTLAELTISPLVGGLTRELAREIGHFVWRGSQDRTLVAVEVVCEDALGGARERFKVDRPFMPGATHRAAAPAPPAAGSTASKATATSAPPAANPNAAATTNSPASNSAASPTPAQPATGPVTAPPPVVPPKPRS